MTKDKENEELRKLFRVGRIKTRYDTLNGKTIVDAYKGRPPTKKEKEEQGYHLIDSLLETYFLNCSV